jgi:hypothetical protein
MLRKGSYEFLRKTDSLENALTAMHILHSSDLPPGSTAELPKDQESPSARAFFDNTVFEKEHWKGLFELLRLAGYGDKEKLMNETNMHINRFVHKGKRVPLSDREKISGVARQALEEVFPSTN